MGVLSCLQTLYCIDSYYMACVVKLTYKKLRDVIVYSKLNVYIQYSQVPANL